MGCDIAQEKAEYDNGIDAKNRFEELLNALDKDDLSAARSLFSLSEAQQQEGFDGALNHLFSYYEGTQEERIRKTVYTTVKEDGKKARFYDSSWDVLTSKDVYRFATRWCVESGKGDASLGIRSLSILRFFDDANCKSLYWGDGLWEPGIHIAIPNKSA